MLLEINPASYLAIVSVEAGLRPVAGMYPAWQASWQEPVEATGSV